MEIVAVDIGGTNARFAIARLSEGRVVALGEPVTLQTRDHASLATCWEAFGRAVGGRLPAAASLAVACPVHGEVLKFTNNPWVIRPASLARELGVEVVHLVNDFGAMGHAVATLGAAEFHHLAGPEVGLPADGVITVVGPGTGFGVAHVLRREGRYFVIETEGGHVDFAPLDAIEDGVLAFLRQRFRRVSVERVVSGPGLGNIYEALAAIEGQAVQPGEDVALWTRALAGTESLAAAALSRFCLSLGSVAGDLALAHGASAVVIAGGIGPRIAEVLRGSGFADRFVAKGRFERMMAGIPVKLLVHKQPGLWGAAAAFGGRGRAV